MRATDRAVVAAHNGTGVVLWCVGAAIQVFIEDGCLWQLCECGLDLAPDGVSVWEGHALWTVDDDGDDCELDGEFREPTDEEWECIRNSDCPWVMEDLYPIDEGDDEEEVSP